VPRYHRGFNPAGQDHCIRPVNPGNVLAIVANSDHSEGCLRGVDTAGFNPREAFFQGQELRDFPPLAREAEIGKVKAPIPRVLMSGKL
jgi:hypothetical protein